MLKNMQKRGAEAIESKKRQLEDDLGRVPFLMGRIQNLHSQFKTACSTLNNDFAELVYEYRTENKKARSSPPPEYFSAPLRPLPKIDFPSVADVPSDLTDERASAHITRLSDFSMRLHSEFQALLAKIQPSSDIVGNDPLQISPRTG